MADDWRVVPMKFGNEAVCLIQTYPTVLQFPAHLCPAANKPPTLAIWCDRLSSDSA
jgi:hypothetical protein